MTQVELKRTIRHWLLEYCMKGCAWKRVNQREVWPASTEHPAIDRYRDLMNRVIAGEVVAVNATIRDGALYVEA